MNSAAARLGLGNAALTFATLALCGLSACAAPKEDVVAPPFVSSGAQALSPAFAEPSAAPHAELSVAVNAKDDGAGDGPRGTLVVQKEVLARCPRVSAAAAGPAVGKMAWLGVMRSLTTCMNEGNLRDRALVLHGASKPQIVVKYIFTKLGLPEARVAMSSPSGESCVTDDACTAEETRVEIGLVDANATAMVGAP